MIGLLLAVFASGLGELSDSIGKYEVRKKVVSYYSFGFLSLLATAISIAAVGIYRDSFIFSLASLPTFIPRLVLEVFQAHISLLAITKADRGDFGVIRVITVPLLLFVDLHLGYSITALQALGIVIIVSSVFGLAWAERFRTKAFWFILASAINAVATISLYKYDISHFNSVEAEQTIVCLVLLLQFYVLARIFGRENPLKLIFSPIFSVQVTASGLASTLVSFAISFAPASIITAGLRASSVLFSILSGRYYFKEKRFEIKFVLFCSITFGLWLLSFT